MNIASMFNFNSKTFWLGAAMVAGGLVEYTHIPVVLDIVKSVWPNLDPGALVSMGLGLIFVRDAIAKGDTATPPPATVKK